VCFLERPTLAAEPPRVLGCVRCKNPMMAVDVGAGSVVHACATCRALFAPPRAWTRAFAARDVIGDLEARIGMAERASIAPLGSCPLCNRQMDRTRFAATSDVVIDACGGGHGVWLASGDLGRAVDYAAHKARIGENAAVREADAAWMKANNIDPRRHAIEAEEARLRAASSARLSKYAKGGLSGLAVVALVRVLVVILNRSHHPHQKTAGSHDVGAPVSQAGANGAADLR
jgi:Zn-finger nucleic acid-binding protein